MALGEDSDVIPNTGATVIDARTINACIDEIVRDLIKRKQERGGYGDSAKSYGMPWYKEIPPRHDSKPTQPRD